MCWIPIWLAAYPGFFCYDAGWQFNQVFNSQITLHHPPLHTLLLGGGAVNLGKIVFNSYNVGISLFLLIQMIIISGIFSYACSLFFENMNIHSRAKKLILILYYSLFPVVSIFSQCSTKDAIFNALVFLFFFLSVNLLKNKSLIESKKYLINYIIIGFLMLSMRNNAAYAMIVWFVMLVLFSRLFNKKILLPILLIIVAYFSYNNILIKGFDFKKGDSREMLSVPLMQISRVYNYNKEYFNEHELYLIYNVIPENYIANNYYPLISDPIKTCVNSIEILNHKQEYLKLYFNTAMHNLSLYLDAFAELTYYSWYPDSIINGYNQANIYPNEGKCYFAAEVEEPGSLDSKLPWLYEAIVRFSRNINFEKVPLLSMFFSIGFMNWIVMLAFVVAIIRKDYPLLFSISFVLLLLCTLLLGPIVLVRYYLISFYLFPILVYYIFNGRRLSSE